MYCKNCGRKLPGTGKFCEGCGTPVGQMASAGAGRPNTALPSAPPTTPLLKQPKRKGCFMGLLIFVAICVVVIAISQSMVRQYGKQGGVSSKASSVAVLVDATKFAGQPLEEVEKLVGPLQDNGSIPLTTMTGEEVDGQSFSPEGSVTQWIFYEGKCVKYQYWSDPPVSYINQMDIFPMFGVSPGKHMRTEANTGKAARYSGVSGAVSEFYVQEMDSVAKTFTVVKCTYDSRFGGWLQPENEWLAFDKKSWEDYKDLYSAHSNLILFMNGYANGEISQLEAYNACNDYEGYFRSYASRFDYGTTEEEKTYISVFSNAAISDQMAAGALKKYLNSLEVADLASAQENIQTAKTAYTTIASNRGKLLVEAGLTEAEIQEKVEQDMAELDAAGS